jgi:hypothetical protein
MCPWCPDANLKLPRLLRAFLKSAAAVQTEGDMLLLGLASDASWAHLYRLPEVVRAARALGYRVLPPDREFLERAHDHGYVHCSSARPASACSSDPHRLHESLFPNLRVHAFLKARDPLLGRALPFPALSGERIGKMFAHVSSDCRLWQVLANANSLYRTQTPSPPHSPSRN